MFILYICDADGEKDADRFYESGAYTRADMNRIMQDVAESDPYGDTLMILVCEPTSTETA